MRTSLLKGPFISFLTGLVISSVFIYFSFRNIPFSEITLYMGTINYWWILPSTLLILICFLLRAWRWQVILNASHDVPFSSAFHPLMIGFMLNCVLPGRVGELARPALLNKNSKIPFTTGLATVAAERVFDLICLLLFFALISSAIKMEQLPAVSFQEFTLDQSTLQGIVSGMIKLSLVLIFGICLVIIPRSRNRIIAIILKSPEWLFFLSSDTQTKIKQKLALPIAAMIENVASGFHLVRSPKAMGMCSLFSLLIWGSQALSYYVFSFGCPGLHISFGQMFVVMIFICFFIALPSVPGYWGLWEAGGIFSMSIFGITQSDAAGFTLVNHALQILPVIIVGVVSAILTGMKFSQLHLPPSD